MRKIAALFCSKILCDVGVHGVLSHHAMRCSTLVGNCLNLKGLKLKQCTRLQAVMGVFVWLFLCVCVCVCVFWGLLFAFLRKNYDISFIFLFLFFFFVLACFVLFCLFVCLTTLGMALVESIELT